MPRIATRDFGELECSSGADLYFPLGLPGFERENHFVLIEQEAVAPIVFVQSTAAVGVCFLAIPVHQIDPAYQIGITEEDQTVLAVGHSENVLCLAILSAHADRSVTANLLAPIIVNLVTRVAVQAVRPDTRYSHEHPIGVAGCS